MAKSYNTQIDIKQVQPAFSITGFVLMLLAGFTGAMVATYVLPTWLPRTHSIGYWTGSQSILVPVPRKCIYCLLASMVINNFGVGITNKLAARWPGLPPAIELHQFSSILGLVFVIFHGLILLGDQYINFQFLQLLIPFSTSSFKPLTVGLRWTGSIPVGAPGDQFLYPQEIGNQNLEIDPFLEFFDVPLCVGARDNDRN